MVSPTWEERQDGMLHRKRFCPTCHRRMRERKGKKPFKKATKIKKAVTKDIPRTDPFQKKEFKKSQTIGQAGIEKAREMLAAGRRTASISNSLKIEEDVICRALGIMGERKVEAVQIRTEAQELRPELDLAHVRQPNKRKRGFYADCAECTEEFKLPPNYLAWGISQITLCRLCRDCHKSKEGASAGPIVIEVPAKKIKSAIATAKTLETAPETYPGAVETVKEVEKMPEKPVKEVAEPNPYLIALEKARSDQKAADSEQKELRKRLEEIEERALKIGFVVRSLEELVGAVQ